MARGLGRGVRGLALGGDTECGCTCAVVEAFLVSEKRRELGKDFISSV